MNSNEKRLVKVIAEQMARIIELEDMLSDANSAFLKLAKGCTPPRAKK